MFQATLRRPWRLLILAAAGLLAGCSSGGALYEFDPAFSVNLVKPVITDKNANQLSPLKYKIYKDYGCPDYMRIMWTRSGEPQTSTSRILRAKGRRVRQLERTWIYLDQGKEFRFRGERGVEQKPLTDDIRTICDEGDPQEIMVYGGSTDFPRRVYRYYSGKQFQFDLEGNHLRTMYFPSMTR